MRHKDDETRGAESAAGQSPAGSTAPSASGPQHSPLPWQIGVNGKCVRHDRESNPQYRRGPIIADCDCSHGLGEAGQVDQANARFIVTACNSHDDLLAALKALVAAEDRFAAESGVSFDDGVSDAVRSARAVIAKAEGK